MLHLANPAALLPHLLNTTLALLLLSSPATQTTTQAVISNLQTTTSLLSCSNLQIFHLPLHPHSQLPPQVANLTHGVKFFPELRLLHTNGRTNLISTRHEHGLDPLALAHLLHPLCDENSLWENVCRYATPVGKDTFARNINGGTRFGGMFCIPGGLARLQDNDILHTWHTFTRAVKQRAAWQVTIVDCERDIVFAQRNGIVQGFVLVDSEQDRVYATTGENNWDDRLRMFELDKVSEIRRVRLPQLRRVLSYFERPCRACVYLRRPRSFVSLRSFVGDSYGRDSGVATAYIFIVARWCAFCQRVLPMYERYIARLQQDCVGVLVDEVHVDDMPEWLESRVEGYPTVLRIVRDVHGVAVMDVTDGLDLGPEHV